jgi:hypothetical protein
VARDRSNLYKSLFIHNSNKTQRFQTLFLGVYNLIGAKDVNKFTKYNCKLPVKNVCYLLRQNLTTN